MKTKNKIIAWVSLVFCFCLTLVTIFSTIYTLNAHAASNQGDESTAIKKLYYRALKSCISDTNSFNNDGGTIFTPLMGAEDLKNGIWFSDGTAFKVTGDEMYDLDGLSTITWAGGAYIENEVTGEFDDGKIYCGEESNGLIKNATSVLGVSYMDLACDYADNGRSSGIFYTDISESYCADNINAGNDMYYSTRRTDYLERVIKAKAFNNNVPGGSLENPTNFEAYHIYYDTFLIACATGSPHYGDTGLAYQIKMYNPSSKKIEQVGFSQKNSAGTKVYTGIDQKTCQQIADSLNEGEYYKAYEDHILELQLEDKKINAASCIGTYNSNYDTLKSKKDAARSLVNTLNLMATAAQNILNKTYIFTYDLEYPAINNTINTLDPAGDSQAISDIKTAANDFLRKINEYRVLDDDAKESGKEDFQNEIDTFKNNIGIFEQTIVEEVEEIYNELPVKGSTNVPTRISESAYLDGSGSFIGEIDGVYKTSSSNELVCLVDQTFTDLNNKLKDSIGVEMSLEEYIPVSHDISDITGSTESAGDPCYSGDVDSMSWILCPAVENMKKTSDGLLGSINKNLLSVKSDLYQIKSQNGKESGTYLAWGYFRDLANLAMILVLIIIIFSQITGAGIDNYGIKKMLPKLVTMAILVNLSYYICVLLIDISNILGESLMNLFGFIGDQIKTAAGVNYVEVTISKLVDAILGATVAVGAGATIIVEGISLIGVGGGGSLIVLLIPLILALLIALVAILMFFVMLGARLVIIILFTAISPLAFVCNILPNTQKIFKKWLDVMKAALVMFPICGALYGLSFVIKAIIFSAQGVHILMGMVAVFSPYIPFLIVPTLLKGALNTLGVVGQKLSGMGDTIKGSMRNAQSAVRNSEQYRDRARIAQDQHAGWRSAKTLGLKNGQLSVNRKGRVRGLYGKLARANGSSATTLDDIKNLDRSLLSDTDRRRLSDAEQTAIKYNVGAGGVLAKNPYIISAKEAQADAEAKNYKTEVERIKATLGGISSNGELLTSIRGSWSSGSKAYRAAALSTMSQRKMGKEMLQFLDQYGTKDFENESLSAIMESGEGLAYNWAKEQSKKASSDRVGFREFMTRTGSNSFRDVVAQNREKVVNMMTDDSFDYLGGRMKGLDGATSIAALPNVISNDLMIKKLSTTDSGKEQTAILQNMLDQNIVKRTSNKDYTTSTELRLSFDSLTKTKESAFAGSDGKFDAAKFKSFMDRVDGESLKTLKSDYNTAVSKGNVRLDANIRAALDKYLS